MQTNLVKNIPLTGPRTRMLAERFLDSWRVFKKELFKELTADTNQLNDVLETFYLKVYNLRKNEIDAKLSESQFSQDKFWDLSNLQKRQILWATFTNQLDPSYEAAFNNLADDEKDILIKGLAYHIGTQKMRNLKPCKFIETLADNYFRNQVKERFTPPEGISFRSSGSSGSVFLVNHAEPYILKVSNENDTSNPKRSYRVGFEKAGIEQANSIITRDHLQKLAKAGNEYLGIDEESSGDGVLATEFIPGISLNPTVQPEQLEQYLSQDGINLESLIDFIQTIFTLATKKGADISAIHLHNIIYDPDQRSLNLVDYTGLDNKFSKRVRTFIKDNPLMFTLYKLISEVILLQASTANAFRNKLGTALKKVGKNLESFMEERFELLTNALQTIAKQGINGFSKTDLVKGLDDLNTAYQKDTYKNLFGPKLGLNEKALDWINKLKASI